MIGGGVVQLGTDASAANTFSGPIVVGPSAGLAIYDDAALGVLNAGDVALGRNIVSLEAGSTLDLLAGGTYAHALVVAGDPTIETVPGTLIVQSGPIGGTGNLVVAGGGTLEMTAANTYAGGTTIEAGTTLVLGRTVAAGTGAIDFGGVAALDVLSGVSLTEAIGHVVLGDVIDLLGLAGGMSAAVVAGTTLDIYGTAGVIGTIALVPSFAGYTGAFTAGADGQGRTVLNVGCFVTGAGIATPSGEVAAWRGRTACCRCAGSGIAGCRSTRLPRPSCSRRCGCARGRSRPGFRRATCCCRRTMRSCWTGCWCRCAN